MVLDLPPSSFLRKVGRTTHRQVRPLTHCPYCRIVYCYPLHADLLYGNDVVCGPIVFFPAVRVIFDGQIF